MRGIPPRWAARDTAGIRSARRAIPHRAHRRDGPIPCLPKRWGKPCRLLARGRLNTCLLEFEQCYRFVTSRYAVRRSPALLIALCSLILTVPSASAAAPYSELDTVVSKFAMRPVSLICESLNEDKALAGAWAYVPVPVRQQHEAYAREAICEGALAVAYGDERVPDWKRALGVAVIVHEAYHLRHWSGAGSEAKVECKAIRHFKVAVQLLGGSRRVADELFPVALAYHYQFVYFSKLRSAQGRGESYEDLTCEVPDVS
jgi:hypothetical protein